MLLRLCRQRRPLQHDVRCGVRRQRQRALRLRRLLRAALPQLLHCALQRQQAQRAAEELRQSMGSEEGRRRAGVSTCAGMGQGLRSGALPGASSAGQQ